MSRTTYTNPSTGKGWTDREEAIISKIMSEEKMSENGDLQCSRPEAIRRMRRRRLDDLKGGFSTVHVPPEASDTPIVCGVRYCLNETSGNHRLPDDARANARYCDRACQQAAYRGRAVEKVA